MSLSFRNRLVLFTFVLTGLASFTLIAFFLLLYWNDKRLTLIGSELEGVKRSAVILNELLDLGRSEDLSKLGESRRLVLTADDACNADSASPPVVSKLYEARLHQQGIEPMDFLNDPAVYRACTSNIPSLKSSDKATFTMLEPRTASVFPAATILVRSPHAPARLLVLFLGSPNNSPNHAQLLLDGNGRVAWSDHDPSEVNALLEQVGIARAALTRTAEALLVPNAKALFREAGDSGLIVAAPVAGSFVLTSVSQMPTLIALLGKQIGDSALLGIAILLVSMFLSRTLGYFLIRPLIELRRSAERIGDGEFTFRFTVSGDDEFAGVKRSLNLMTEKVAALFNESARKVALESEFQVTRSVQELFFPPTQVRLADLEMSSFTDTATQCGGDWWGYIETRAPDGRPLTVVMIGDVTGHGVSSALMTAAVRGGAFVLSRRLETEPALALDPGRMMALVNRSLMDAGQGNMNMTFFITVFDPHKTKIHCANAAHVQSYLMHAEGSKAGKKITAIGAKSGITLGENVNATYETESHDWYLGSKLFLYTDGLTDVVVDDKNLFERKTLRKIIGANQDGTAEQLLATLMAERDVVAKGQPKVDDVTVVVCAATVEEATAPLAQVGSANG